MQALILTGIVAGFVHVVSGADHLIAMAPAAINNPQKAQKIVSHGAWDILQESSC